MGTWREARSFAAGMLVLGIVSATTIVSCGGSSDGDSNGGLCEQCGDTDGPCNIAGATVSGNDRPEGCTTDPCDVQLQCVRKVDSGQRRCFPLNPTTDSLDFRYECDGSRPALVPTPRPEPTATLTPNATATPTDTGPTATGATPTSTAPTPTATPGEAEPVTVDITIADPDDDDLPSSFSATVTYPASKGSFLLEGDEDCTLEEGLTAQDDGAGTLTLTFSGDTDGISFVDASCDFHQLTGQTLVDADLNGTVNAGGLTITIAELL